MPRLVSFAGLIGALLCLSVASAVAQPYKVGMTTRLFVPDGPYDWRGATTHALITQLWYPAVPDAVERPLLIGPPGTPFFTGGMVAESAAPLPGARKFPLILLSHGTGGVGQSLAWLGTELARHGYIVAAVNHPGNTAIGPYTTQGFALWWLRATDLSVVIDKMLADPEFGPRIDAGRIGGAGHSLGGYTMIELAGGLGSVQQLEAFCQASPAALTCKPPPEYSALREKELALAKSDPAFAKALKGGEVSRRDPRVRAVFAMAPALGPSFSAASLRAISIPVAIVAGAGDDNVPVAESAKYLAANIPGAALSIYPGAVGHYVFTAVCTATGKRQLPPQLCDDAPGVDRAAIQAETVNRAIAFFAAHLK